MSPDSVPGQVILGGDSKLPRLNQPGFYVRRHALEGKQVSSYQISFGNRVAITILFASDTGILKTNGKTVVK